jgi:hypothetical protein
VTGEHFWRGLLLSAVLNALAGGAALALGLRARPTGRSELALMALMTWNFLVMCPVYALGLCNHLTARALAWVSAPLFAIVLAIARGRRPVGEFAGELGRAAVRLVLLPFDACIVAVRARSFVALAIVFTFATVLWMLFCSYLTPSWKQWDALWYHEPMVGFAIQNHGLAFADLPPGSAQKINGYPKLCEMTQLWFVIFTDRRVIDMVGYLAVPGLALSVYVLARRYTSDRVTAMGFGCVLVLMPAVIRLLGSTYVDAHNAAFVLAGTHFATRAELRIRDAFFATMSLALAVGSKTMALVPVFILAMVAAARLLGSARRRPAAALGTVALGIVVIAGTAAITYARNWHHFGNPFWPDLKYDNDKWGIHWPGAEEWAASQFERGEARLNMNLPVADFLKLLYRPPYGSPLPHYDQMYEYGLGITWVALPAAVLAILALCLALVRDVVARLIGHSEWRAAPETHNIVPVVLTLAAILYFSPALWGARYQIAAAGLVLVVLAWAAGRRGMEPVGEGIAAALTALAFVSFVWMTPRTWLKWSEARAFAKIPFPEREFTPASAISPDLEIWNGSPVTLEVGLAREKQLAPGAALVFPDYYGTYMALFWNNDFSNRAVYLPSGPDYVERLAKTDALWAYCGTADPGCSSLGDPGSGWELVGRLDVENHGKVFRRTRW